MLLLGGRIHLALGDLAMWIEPRFAADQRSGRMIRPWLGLLVIALLVAGLVLAGEGIGYVVEAVVPHRETRQ